MHVTFAFCKKNIYIYIRGEGDMQGVLILILKWGGGGGRIPKILTNNNHYKVVLKPIKEKTEFVRPQP